MKMLPFLLSSALMSMAVSQAAVLVASENAGLSGSGTVDESTTMTLRNRFGYAGRADERYAYFRFTMDAANNTVAGIDVNNIQSVTLDLHFTTFTAAEGLVFALDDNANPGTGFLTETTWAAEETNELSGPIAPHGNVDVRDGSALVTQLGTYVGSGIAETGLFHLSLDVTEFKNMITASTNNEFTLIVDGPANSNNAIASLGNITEGITLPQLTIVPIPEPSSIILAGIALIGGLVLAKKRA
jgi:hypothetical protein